jgi:hypothetical protein
VIVWVYAGGGQAEIGIIPWLQQHFPGVRFERRMPQIRKPGPRPGVMAQHQVVGHTGRDLEGNIRRNIEQYWTKNAAHTLLLLDDTDCEIPLNRSQSLEKAVTGVIAAEELPCIVIALAVPELEAWLLADWHNTFEKDYRRCHVQMRDVLRTEGVDFAKLEEFDCRCGTPEYRKISETLRNAFEVCCGTSPGYSKDTDTRRLLLQTNPATIANFCPNFRAFWINLNACLKVSI